MDYVNAQASDGKDCQAALVIVQAACAQATAARIQFDIAPQAASSALIEFGRQADITILIGADARDIEVPGLKGEYGVEEGLELLLKGTGLRYRISYQSIFVDRAIADSQKAEPRTTAAPAKASPRGDTNRKRGALAAFVAAILGSAAADSNADQATEAEAGPTRLEEVKVTATKREQRLLDVPISIAVVTADDIDRRGLVNAEDYLRGIPGVSQVDGGGIGGQAIIVRGIETNLAYQNFNAGPTTATYFGETPTTNSAGLLGSNVDLKLVDIERVEVLRGPQGTAFGSSSMGGVVRTIPLAPKLDRVEGRVYAGYSATSGTGGDNYNGQVVSNIPLIKDKLAIRATGYLYQDSGFYHNVAGSDAAFQAAVVIPLGAEAFAVDEDEVGDYYVIGGRAAAKLQASDDLRFTLSYVSQKTETDGYPFATSGTFQQTTLRVAPEHVRRGQNEGFSDTDINIVNAMMEYDFGWADLLATYSYLEGGTTVATPYTAYDLPWAASINLSSDQRGHVGEIRLATKLEGAWNFLSGLYVENNDDEYDWDILWYGDPATNFFAPGERFVGAFLDRRNLEQKAAFGEASWEFLPNLTLTGGVRAYEYDRTVRTDQSGPILGGDRSTQDDAEASGENFRTNLSYKPNSNALLYAGWAQGFRMGKPQPGVPPGLCDLDNDSIIDGTNITIESTKIIDSDTVDSYELGAKFALLDRRLTIAADVFRMEWSDIPVAVSVGGVAGETCAFVYTTNAGAALSEGVELQANFQMTEAFRVDFGGAWIDARLTEDVPAQGFSDGDRLPGSPKVNANLSAQYDFEIGGYKAFVRADSIYVGSFYGDLLQSANLKSGDYVKLDASARMEIGNLNVDLFFRNLTDEDAFTNRGGNFTSTEFYGYRLRPRTIGLQLGYTF